ncbi:uncharacterized protein TNCV_3630121 [Trichonephila clavipes]|nr:uncharacterized protein TNCV_3630121 [Trichonephila clavipes]
MKIHLFGIRLHYEQLSEFERGRIIGLKEAGWANRRIARHMGGSDAGKNEWTITDFSVMMVAVELGLRRNHTDYGRIVFSGESRFQLCPGDHRRRVWRRPGQRADPAFTIARHTGSQPGVMTSRLPDLSPIKHDWDMMGSPLHLPGNADDLARQMKQIWQEIP